MKQVLIIHGGSSFSSYESYLRALNSSTVSYERMKRALKWRDWLTDALPSFDILTPDFPNKQNAQYDEWKITFEKILPHLTGDVILVGYSLGAMFLARYLHEHTLSTPVRSIVLVAPSYDDESVEELGTFKIESAMGIEKSAGEVHLFHSEDDPVSPFSELKKFQADLPSAITHTFVDRNHFFQPTFPELASIIESV